MLSLPYIVLIEYVIGIIFELIGFLCFLFILIHLWLKQKNGNGLFLSMYFYMFSCILQSFFGILHLFYMNFLWKADSVIYNSYIMFISGFPASLLLLSNSFCVSFLSLDRILTILFPLKYSSKFQFSINICFIIFLFSYNFIVILFDVIPGWPESSVTQCRSFGCIPIKTQMLIYLNTRYCIAALNVFLGIFLGILLRKNIYLNSVASKANRLIIITLINAFIFDFLPHSTAFVSYTIFNFQITSVVGPYSLFVGSLDHGICAILYSKILLKEYFCKRKFKVTVLMKTSEK